jgi:hypothetical protein
LEQELAPPFKRVQRIAFKYHPVPKRPASSGGIGVKS